jgi:hypothetical protein
MLCHVQQSLDPPSAACSISSSGCWDRTSRVRVATGCWNTGSSGCSAGHLAGAPSATHCARQKRLKAAARRPATAWTRQCCSVGVSRLFSGRRCRSATRSSGACATARHCRARRLVCCSNVSRARRACSIHATRQSCANQASASAAGHHGRSRSINSCELESAPWLMRLRGTSVGRCSCMARTIERRWPVWHRGTNVSGSRQPSN